MTYIEKILGEGKKITYLTSIFNNQPTMREQQSNTSKIDGVTPAPLPEKKAYLLFSHAPRYDK